MESDEKTEDFVPVENLLKMEHLEQYVNRVLHYSSKYNTDTSYYYSPINLIGKYEKYPAYGDFPEAYFLRSYGNWWKQSEAYQLDYRPQDCDPLGVEDYIVLEFQCPVVPRDICIYEVYNPGAVVRIWGKIVCPTKFPWILLWEGPPQRCPPESRKFHPQIKKTNVLINIIRLEFNQSHLQYHYSIDAVLLGGYRTTTDLQCSLILKGLIDNFKKDHPPTAKKMKPVCDRTNSYKDLFEQLPELIDSFKKDYRPTLKKMKYICDTTDCYEDLLKQLPYEVIIHIFQYLDLKTLSRCAQVNKTWNEASSDPVLYQNLSLKPYWYMVNCSTLEYFMNKCKTLKRLDLSWCGHEVQGFGELIIKLLSKCCWSLTHLSLGNCKYMTEDMMVEISHCTQLVDLRLKNVRRWHGPHLDNLNKLVSLDLTSTDIGDDQLISILKANPNLKHIIIDLCDNLVRMDQVVEVVEKYNTQLTTWSSWKTFSLSIDGIKHFANCPHLKELDLGWCLMNTDPGDCIERIVSGCPKLKRLILSEWRGLNDHLLMGVLMGCKELTQLDLLGIKNISADFCEKALVLLPKLRLLDISFCEMIREEEVEVWRQRYPHVTIQRSCQYAVHDFLFFNVGGNMVII